MTDRPPPMWLQVAAWIAGIVACIYGMLDGVAEWSASLATVQLIALAVAPVVLMLPRRSAGRDLTPEAAAVTWQDYAGSLLLGALSFGVAYLIGLQIGDAPPAYHDEFSYLFQAKTLLAGRFWIPSHPTHPELFDQLHVLNEGRMASRYYPGTGLWLAPFVAMGHPFLAPCVAGAVATTLVYWAGREIGGRVAAVFAALSLALSPGMALFGNTLLSHHPTLIGLTTFLLGVLRWRRTRSSGDAWLAGLGLSYAMLCRPMTAAAVGLPFGIDVLACLTGMWGRTVPGSNDDKIARRTLPSLLGFGIPLMLGWGVMIAYNQSVTGNWLTSPYQLYTDLYTPRHVYGFNNVVRGEQHLGPKVIDAYDRWAINLTPRLAVDNLLVRWVTSWVWTFDGLPLLVSAVVILGCLRRLDRRWLLILFSIASLHLLHIPYWYVGIMGWHYVFESAALWCLVLGAATSLLMSAWNQEGRQGLSIWWCCLLAICVSGIYWVPKPSRIERGVNPLAEPRHRHAQLRRWVERQVEARPALVLVEQETPESLHLDLVVNDPGLQAELLFGRYRPGRTDLEQIRRDFPDRYVYVIDPGHGSVYEAGRGKK